MFLDEIIIKFDIQCIFTKSTVMKNRFVGTTLLTTPLFFSNAPVTKLSKFIKNRARFTNENSRVSWKYNNSYGKKTTLTMYVSMSICMKKVTLTLNCRFTRLLTSDFLDYSSSEFLLFLFNQKLFNIR